MAALAAIRDRPADHGTLDAMLCCLKGWLKS
jgi:hypothetical protein